MLEENLYATAPLMLTVWALTVKEHYYVHATKKLTSTMDQDVAKNRYINQIIMYNAYFSI